MGGKLSFNLQENLDLLEIYISNSFDIVKREILLGENIKGVLIYIKNTVKEEFIMEGILEKINKTNIATKEGDLIATIKTQVSTVACAIEIQSPKECIDNIYDGNCILLIDNCQIGISFSISYWSGRNVTEAITEGGLMGPLEAFNENIITNLSLIRKRLRTHYLKSEAFTIGTVSNTKVVLTYLENKADMNLVKDVRNKLKGITTEIINDSAVLAKMLEESCIKIFPTYGYTERPDKVAFSLNDGRVAVVVDGSPFVLILPAVLLDFVEVPEDRYDSDLFGFIIRSLRIFCFIMSLVLPAFYIALTAYHRSLIPITLLIKIAAFHAEVPFDSIIEIFLMEITFEILREAGLRLPKPAGQAVGIVGGLVIGQGTVQAGIVSQEIVIIVALTGICSFAVPGFKQEISVRLLRFFISGLAAMLGMYGLILGITIVLLHLVTLKSFSYDYFYPFSPLSIKELKKMFFIQK